jgi:hypothetical protein
MSQYGQVVTSKNLESLIEYYQLGPGRDQTTDLPTGDQISSPAKRFTALLGRAFLERLHHLTTAQQAAIVQALWSSLRTKDIQVYVAETGAEALLAKNGLDGGTTHGPGDGLTISDANMGTSKANAFTTTTYDDRVSLDGQGNATHQLTITYQYHVSDPRLLYGPSPYFTYLRVYAPPTARLISQHGFTNFQGHDQLNHSDLSWRQMWGGYLLIPMNTTYVVQLSWQVPRIATHDATGRWHYQLTTQHQAGAKQRLQLQISAPGNMRASFSGALSADHSTTVSYPGK